MKKNNNSNYRKYVQQISSIIIDSVNKHSAELIKRGNFKVICDGVPGKYYLDRVSGSYESSLPNLIHKIMWYEGIYDEIISDKKELNDIQDIINNYPDEIYSPDTFNAQSDDEIVLLEQLSDLINLIHYESIITIKNHLTQYKHFDASEFTFHGY